MQILSRKYRVSWPKKYFLSSELANQFYKRGNIFREFPFFLFLKMSQNFRQISEIGPKKHTKYA